MYSVWSKTTRLLSTTCRRKAIPATTTTRITSISSQSFDSTQKQTRLLSNKPKTNMTTFTVHSTFRNMIKNHQKMLPHGLEWDLGGESFVAYVPMNNSSLLNGDKAYPCGHIAQDTPGIRRAIVEAHNRWCFAKDLPFRTESDIDQLIVPNHDNNMCYYVQWKQSRMLPRITESNLQRPQDVLENDPSATGEKDPAQVYINGITAGLLEPKTLPVILDSIAETPSLNLCVKRCDEVNCNVIRVERRFRGGLRHKQDIFEHMLDNLYAMEDVEVLEDNDNNTTIIGSATLPDWIMGGDLTSRLWVQEDKSENEGGILFLRPLYHDDLDTSDRRFRLKKGEDDEMINIVQKELQRLTYLALLPPPYPELNKHYNENEVDGEVSKDKVDALASFTSRERQHRRNRRRFFGM